jgi:hypothetical protein
VSVREPGKSALPEAVPSRPDTVTAAVVENGIALQRTRGLKYAADFLREQMVPVDVATRVLLRPLERRKLKAGK